MCSLLSYASQCRSRCSPQKMATRSLDGDCHPEAAESHAQASDSQRRISVLRGRKKIKTGCPISRVLCEKWDGVRQERLPRHPRRTRRRIRQEGCRLGNYDGQELNRSYRGPTRDSWEGHGFSHATKLPIRPRPRREPTLSHRDRVHSAYFRCSELPQPSQRTRKAGPPAGASI